MSKQISTRPFYDARCTLPLIGVTMIFVTGTFFTNNQRSLRTVWVPVSQRCPVQKPILQLEPKLKAAIEDNPSLDAYVKAAKTYFISYGDDRYKDARVRIGLQARESGMFDNITIFAREDIAEDYMAELKEPLSRKRGGGYWLWKFHFIKRTLSHMKNGEFLVYADADFTIVPNASLRFYDFLKLANVSRGGMLGFRSTNHEREWTSDRVFHALGLYDNEDFMDSFQVLSGLLIFQKNEQVDQLIEMDMAVIHSNPLVITDDYNVESSLRRPEFIENRHDQSIFSVSTKCFGIVGVRRQKRKIEPFEHAMLV